MLVARSIKLSDEDKSRQESETYHACGSDEAISQWCLRRMSWKDAVGAPQIEMLPELLKTLSILKIYPTNFEIVVTAPKNMSLLQLSVDNQDHIRDALSQSQHLHCHFRRCARQDLLAYEMLQLGSLTMAYFSGAYLQSPDLSFDDYPFFYGSPTVSFSDLLPSKACPHLKTLSLCHVCCHENDLESSVDRQRSTIRRLTLYEMHLLSGEWLNCLDHLRHLSKLEFVELSWPTGGEFGDDPSPLKSCPKEEALVTYILHGGQDPLKYFVREYR